MEQQAQQALEQEIRHLCGLGHMEAAATGALRGYGPQIFGLLVALHRDEEEAADVFSAFSEDLWRGLARFEWSCSFRTWAYTLARNASSRHKKHANRRARRDMPLSGHPALSAVEQQVRTETLPFLRTDAKRKMAALRQALSDEDQLLLILRVDKQLSWEDLARVMLGSSEPQAADALKKEAARLRKRFQLVKERLIDRSRREGLLERPGSQR